MHLLPECDKCHQFALSPSEYCFCFWMRWNFLDFNEVLPFSSTILGEHKYPQTYDWHFLGFILLLGQGEVTLSISVEISMPPTPRSTLGHPWQSASQQFQNKYWGKIRNWWHRPVILALRRQRQENHYKFEANLGYRMSSRTARAMQGERIREGGQQGKC